MIGFRVIHNQPLFYYNYVFDVKFKKQSYEVIDKWIICQAQNNLKDPTVLPPRLCKWIRPALRCS